ncbi:hypothetical protein B0J11DRAFT_179867 [Dendryphion nanum]|uniref:Secreted protein n=1 Tax=Dendryphion nanum TaxID=256645 RepID=A0A9P9EEU9_9PLEO|nr:hypothetical protein B0J11DRAFT_179867 [Dendryphion nanum]
MLAAGVMQTFLLSSGLLSTPTHLTRPGRCQAPTLYTPTIEHSPCHTVHRTCPCLYIVSTRLARPFTPRAPWAVKNRLYTGTPEANLGRASG